MQRDQDRLISYSGGYAIGGPSTFKGDDLVSESNNGVIAVIIQYRLGLFGFLADETVKKDGALNAGICEYPWLSPAA